MTQTASILVTDLVGSTALRVELGEVRAEQVRQAHDAAVGDAVRTHRGIVVKGLGDGVLARFASAEDAIAAAVAAHQAVDLLARREQLDLALRAGISAGDVTVDDDGDCFGLPVVEAARLCAAAEDGTTLVADVARALARGRGPGDFTAAGARELKGLEQPVETWTVTWAPLAAEGALRDETPFVGRDKERAHLAGVLEATAQGRGATVLVVGEPGIGKTRLLREATIGRSLVLWGSCHEGELVPREPFVELLTTWARETDAERVRRALGADAPVLATAVAPAIREVLPDIDDPPNLTPQEVGPRVQDAVTQWLTRLSAERPVAIVVDDLHWADEATMQLFRAVARAGGKLPLTLIGTYRDTDVARDHPLSAALPLLRREVEPDRIALSGIGGDDVAVMLSRLTGVAVPTALAEFLARECNGNPFFIRETLLHLVEDGRLDLDRVADHGWETPVEQLGIPEGVREVLGRRLARLSEAGNRLLEVGALFDDDFLLPVASQVARLDEDAALDAVDEALDAAVIEPTNTFDSYRFTHALFRQTLRAELNPSRVVRWHRAIAEVLAARAHGETSPAEAAAVARHYWLSAAIPGAEAGAAFARQAGDAAAASGAHREAYEAYAIARELLGDDAPTPLELQQALAEAALLGQVDVDVVVAEAEALAALLVDRAGTDAALDVMGELIEASMMLEDAEVPWRIAEAAERYVRPDRRDRVWAVVRMNQLNARELRDPAGPTLVRDTDERRAIHAAVVAGGRGTVLASMFSAPSRPEALALLQTGGAAEGPALSMYQSGLGQRALTLYHTGEWEQSLEAYEASLAAGEDRGVVASLALYGVVMSRMAAVLGRHDEAIAALARATELVPRLREGSNNSFQVLAASVLCDRVWGATGFVLAASPEALTSNPNTRWARGAILASEALGMAERGQADESIARIDSIIDDVEHGARFAPNYTQIVVRCSQALFAARRTDHLDVLERNLHAKVIEPDHRYDVVDGRWAAGLLASLRGDHDEARAWFERSRDLLVGGHAYGLLVSVAVDAAIAETRRPEPEAARVDRWLDLAREHSTHPAMARWLPRIDAVAQVGTNGPGAASPASRD